jgi:hypothetical protein
MRKVILNGLFLVCLLTVSGAAPQFPPDKEKPVWTMETLKVKPEMFGSTLGYLDDNWMRVRAEAKRQGAVLSYNRIAGQDNLDGHRSIVLLTEFKNGATYYASGKLFASIAARLPNNMSHVFKPLKQADLYETVSTRVFEDYSVVDDARFQLLSKN